MKIRRLILCFFLSFIVAVTLIPVFAFAEDEAEPQQKATELTEQVEMPDLSEHETAEESDLNAEEFDNTPAEDRNATTDDLYIGETASGSLPEGYETSYVIRDAYYSSCHVYVENMNANEGDTLSFYVCDEDNNIKGSLSTDELYLSEYSDYDENAYYYLEGNHWFSLFYTLSEGDRIVLMADNADIEYSIVIQEIAPSREYWYGDFNFNYLYNEAFLWPINLDSNYQKDSVLYLENDSYRDFSFYIISGDNYLLPDTDGWDWYKLESDYYISTGYTFDLSENYYLLIFYTPDQADYYSDSYWDIDYDADAYDCDYALAMTPKYMKYYKTSGVANKTYTGKSIKMGANALNVEYRDVIMAAGSDYTVSYANNLNVGTATISFKGKSPLSGSIKKTFKINPKGTSLSSVKAAKKAFKVNWKKQATKMSKARITGYQIQYSTNNKFKSGNKLVTVKGYKSTSKKIKKLKKKKKYYVRIRTYMKVSGKTYYSAWSKAKAVKTR